MRGAARWVAVLALAAVVTVVAGFTAYRALAPSVLVVEGALPPLRADGFSSSHIQIHSSTGRELRDLRVTSDDPRRVAVESVVTRGNAAVVTVRAGVQAGDAKLTLVATGSAPETIALQTTLDASDSLGDGTPDFLRLHDAADRKAFRRWFTLLAESQYFRQTPSADVGDCAALLRYAYRETLSRHDAAWAKAVELPVPPSASEVRQWQYPYTPLGAGLFRVRPGSFTANDLTDGVFAQFADAKTLWRLNAYFVGREMSQARPGDLLFFRQEGHDLQFHAMIYVGPSTVEAAGEPVVVYHTGADGKSPGEVRRPTLAQLLEYPDPRWRPVPSNPSFLGVYRWNILRGPE